jgi:D-sedoheptulose 7-phosphate isomerase
MMDAASLVAQILGESADLHDAARSTAVIPAAEAAMAVVETLRTGGKVLVFGNGGSATDAQHFAAELVGRFTRERRGLAAIALAADSAIVTALANDYGYERVFARQVEALGREGDVAIGISTSGTSANVLAGLAAAEAAGMVTVGMTGRDGGTIATAVDIHVNVASTSTARVQEVHRTLLHAMCELIEREPYA